MIKNKKIIILGAGKSGLSAAKLLSKDNDVIISDIKEINKESKDTLDKLNVTVVITELPENLITSDIDMLIKSPGINQNNGAVKKALEMDIEVINEIELAYNYIPKDTFIIGITGSNGKTTTTTMTYEILKKMGKNVILGGNIGIPLCDTLDSITSDAILVLEISDHQLLNMSKFKTNISLLTNICPTHLDFHENYDAYKNVKKKIFNNHSNSDLAFVNKSNEDSYNLVNGINSNVKYYNDFTTGNYIDDLGIYINNELVIDLESILVVGKHNYENILASLMIVNYFGINKDIVKKYLSNFKGVEHRIEYVNEINNVKYYNDSKATNPTSVITALNTFNKPIHLILGGMERNQDFNELNESISKVKYIYAIGELTDRIYDYAVSKNINVIKCYTLKSAVENIKNNNELLENEIVLLSPGSASWDQYPNFEIRGNEFKNLVNK